LAAVVHRELRANGPALDQLERALTELTGDAAPTRLRLHDLLLWLATTMRITHAIELGRGTAEWRAYRG
jgi:hypothetical protein